MLTFGLIYGAQSLILYKNQSKLISFKSDIQSSINTLKSDLPIAGSFYESLKDALSDMGDTASPYGTRMLKISPSIRSDATISSLLDSLNNKDSTCNQVLSNLKTAPDKLNDDLYIIDRTSNYIFYGIFVLIFGVLTRPGSGKAKTVESPIPGYPTSDISASIVNKLLDAVDIIPKGTK